MDRLLWTQILDMGPPLRRFTAMSYDSDRDRVALFGGGIFVARGPDGYPTEIRGQDTWEFDGDIWMQMEDMGPPGRTELGMCYDSRRQRTVLHGGAGQQGVLHDTWEWDGSLWTQVAENGPLGARTITYDAQHGYALVFAYPTKEAPHGSTWGWDGNVWTQLDDQGAGVGYGVMAYDASAQQVLLCTDTSATPTPQPGPPTFTWTGSSWKQISDIGVHQQSAGSSMCFDGKETILYLPGLTQTWTWLGSRWVQRQDMGPSPRLGTALAGDTKRQRSILFGQQLAGGPPETQQSPETWALRRFPAAEVPHN